MSSSFYVLVDDFSSNEARFSLFYRADIPLTRVFVYDVSPRFARTTLEANLSTTGMTSMAFIASRLTHKAHQCQPIGLDSG